MYITDNIIRNALKNVYFIWGRGKTTVSEVERYFEFDISDKGGAV